MILPQADVPVRVRRVTTRRCFDEGESGNQQWTEFLKSLCVTLLINFFFWPLTSWFGQKRKLPNTLPKNNTLQSHVISPHTLRCPSLSTSLRGNSIPLPTRNSAWPSVWDTWAGASLRSRRPHEQIYSKGWELCPGREPLTAPSLHWRCTNKQQSSDEYLFASKLANVLAQPGTSNRCIRILHILLADK